MATSTLLSINERDALDAICDLTPYDLADRNLADCGTPDNEKSAGAELLVDVRDAFAEWVRDGGNYLDDDDVSEKTYQVATTEDLGGVITIWTSEKWAAFIDLKAYQEDAEDIILRGGDTFEDMATAALSVIAERLFRNLAEEYYARVEELEDDEDDEDDDLGDDGDESGYVFVA